jgi:hypothetical protein
MNEKDAAARWLVLLYHFPKGPGSRRVRVWRRLQSVGSVAIRNSVYLLPRSEQSREDFEWILKELRSSGADGAILESQIVGGMTDQQIKDLFNAARSADYQGLREEIETALAALPAGKIIADEDVPGNGRRALARARKRIAEIEAVDFFAAEGHDVVEAAMRTLVEQTTDRIEEADKQEKTMAAAVLHDLADRVWVTRRGVRVDRIASAWLIRRWIDSGARFKFVAGKDYVPADREVRFDMFEAEFTHEGELCTFEVLARLVGPNDAALRSVGEIVHDIDLKDAKYGRPETAGVAHVLDGIVAGTDDDERRIDRGGELFEGLYRFFGELKA